jgi:hypothetical protein
MGLKEKRSSARKRRSSLMTVDKVKSSADHEIQKVEAGSAPTRAIPISQGNSRRDFSREFNYFFFSVQLFPDFYFSPAQCQNEHCIPHCNVQHLPGLSAGCASSMLLFFSSSSFSLPFPSLYTPRLLIFKLKSPC